ncbi:alpha/beta fold hydrolase [Nocardioides bruguierae]|uniref:alpha/beta fold hydrolase n=1 Tax=Nocardioides bruguierae TaxID=2945102 RepID=UPI0020216061|nr:alpha/beta fold hydrolase [Nocardioides bruguierae]MCL8027166.1 alpha/beta fold hydrolase [Nocardioides bruguierae]
MSVTAVRLGGRPDLPLLVLGPSLGTSATALWSRAAALLAEDFQVVGFDLPGHGHDRSAPASLTMAELAAAVLEAVDRLTDSLTPVPFHYAGDSVGGAVGLQLLLDAPARVLSATLLCTGARIGTEEAWRDRMATVRESGTPAMVAGSAQRWFAPGFSAREPEASGALLESLAAAVDGGYVAVCEALATFDVRDRLGEVVAPVLAVAGAEDPVTTPATLAEIADGVPGGRLEVLDGVGHLAPVEAPEVVARLVRTHALGEPVADVGSCLDGRSLSLVALAALVGSGRVEGLAEQVRAARTHGLGGEEIEECLHRAATSGGIADADDALRIARQVLAEG